jgi:hypothetical protein
MRIIALLLVITACAAGAAAAPSESIANAFDNATEERDATTAPEGNPDSCTAAGAAASEEEEVFFPSVTRAVPYLGPNTKEAFAFRSYNATELVLGWGLSHKDT